MKSRLMKMLGIITTVSAFYAVPVSAEENVLTLDGARIRGNQELPTVLYVVPWQPPTIKNLEVSTDSPAIKLSLETLERSEFQRKVSYHQAFVQQQEESGVRD